jgi:L-arabinose isomerase
LFKRDYGSARIGVFGAGLAAYWPQFAGLKERLLAHQAYFEGRLRDRGYTVISAGLVDTSRAAAEAGDAFRRQGVDFLMCYMSTYATSSLILPVVQRAAVPMVIVALQPTKAMDYANGTTFMQLEHDNTTSLPEVCCALLRASLTGARSPGPMLPCARRGSA